MRLADLTRNRLWVLQSKLRDGRCEKYDRLTELQWQDRESARALQRTKLEDLLTHAHTHVPYYGEILTGYGVVSDDGRVDLDRFEAVPVLDKSTLKDNFEALKSDDLDERDWYRNSTGGSTGEPAAFLQDTNYSEWRIGADLLYDDWAGYTTGEPRIKLWGSERDVFDVNESLQKRVGKELRNETWLNGFMMSSEDMHSYVETINAVKPTNILAYAECIYELAKFVDEHSMDVYSPDSILSSAGTLYPNMRETIESAFDAPVFNRYGSREMGDIACECPAHEGLHVCAPTHYVEILNDDGEPVEPGELGEIVVTSLENYAMPLIRYRIGDMAVKTDDVCSCGRGWPLLAEITGRVTDVFRKADGTVVSPEYFIHAVGVVVDAPWLSKFQVVQTEYDRIEMSLVDANDATDPLETYRDELADLTAKIRLVMGDDCEVTYEFVDEIAPTDSGKYRYTISKVADD